MSSFRTPITNTVQVILFLLLNTALSFGPPEIHIVLILNDSHSFITIRCRPMETKNTIIKKNFRNIVCLRSIDFKSTGINVNIDVNSTRLKLVYELPTFIELSGLKLHYYRGICRNRKNIRIFVPPTLLPIHLCI